MPADEIYGSMIRGLRPATSSGYLYNPDLMYHRLILRER